MLPQKTELLQQLIEIPEQVIVDWFGVSSIAQAKYIIQQYPAILNITDEDGTTLLHKLSIDTNNFQLIKFLLDSGIDYSIEDNDNFTAFDLLQDVLLLRPIQILIANKMLFDAENAGEANIALNYSAEINAMNNDGHTPLCLSVKDGRVELTEFLIDNKADINFKAKDGSTPLTIANKQNNCEIAQLLISNGVIASIEPQETKASARDLLEIHKAVETQNVHKVLEVIKRDNLNINSKNESGDTPLHIAITNYNGAVNNPDVQLHNYYIIYALLIEGADPVIQDLDGLNCFDLAITKVEELIKSFSKYNASKQQDIKATYWEDFNFIAEDFFNKTRPHAAISPIIFGPNQNNAPVDINAQDEFGNTMLHMAVIDQDIFWVFELLLGGIDVLIANGDGLNALQLALSKPNEVVSCFIIDKLIKLKKFDEIENALKDTKNEEIESYKKIRTNHYDFPSDPIISKLHENNKYCRCIDDFTNKFEKIFLEVINLKNYTPNGYRKYKEESLSPKYKDFKKIFRNGNSYLHQAIEIWGLEEITSALYNTRNEYVNQPNESGDTPLHIAIRNYSIALNTSNNLRSEIFLIIIQLLLFYGANVEVNNYQGISPLSMAEDSCKKIFEVLKNHKDGEVGYSQLINACAFARYMDHLKLQCKKDELEARKNNTGVNDYELGKVKFFTEFEEYKRKHPDILSFLEISSSPIQMNNPLNQNKALWDLIINNLEILLKMMSEFKDEDLAEIINTLSIITGTAFNDLTSTFCHVLKINLSNDELLLSNIELVKMIKRKICENSYNMSASSDEATRSAEITSPVNEFNKPDEKTNNTLISSSQSNLCSHLTIAIWGCCLINNSFNIYSNGINSYDIGCLILHSCPLITNDYPSKTSIIKAQHMCLYISSAIFLIMNSGTDIYANIALNSLICISSGYALWNSSFENNYVSKNLSPEKQLNI